MQKYKDHTWLLWATISQWHGQPGRNGQILRKVQPSRLKQEETEIMNKSIAGTEIKTVTKNLPRNKSLRTDGFTGEFYQTFREELMPVLLKLIQTISEEGTFPNSFYEATITMIPKPDKDITKKKIISQYHLWT